MTSIGKTKWIKLPLAGKYRQGTRSIGHYYAELLGWVLSDGHFRKGRTNVLIHQSSVKIKYVNRLRFLLNKLPIKFTEYQNEGFYKDNPDRGSQCPSAYT